MVLSCIADPFELDSLSDQIHSCDECYCYDECIVGGLAPTEDELLAEMSAEDRERSERTARSLRLWKQS